ncbi:MAG: 2-C-methyl-D-erythritol 2,4-cyclodiphosphate synthase, partial [Firmicutes bacterium]|nr:2-C-methyl-D-erythritol 2,4-cyclodiphosphate synthase [Bacillota bacterium]
LLGAAALRDIGYHFPDSDERYRGADSLKLLEEVIRLLDHNGFIPVNVDGTVIAQRPKILPYIPQMCENMAKIIWPDLPLEEAVRRINVKGTTTEKLGFCGRGEGIASEAVCSIRTK